MTSIYITALTAIGESAIKQHYKESTQVSFKNRLIFKTAGYKQKIVSVKPYTLLLTMNNMHSGNPVFVGLLRDEIEKAMKLNGCEKEDYEIEVKY